MVGNTREPWADEEFELAELWDKRCNDSLAAMSERLEQNAGSSFSSACGESLRQSAGNIFGHESTTIEGLQQGHYEQSAKRSAPYENVIVAQDTSFVNYSGHTATQGLGFIDSEGKSRGLVMHTALALSPDGLPLGVVGQETWARDAKKRGKRHRRKKKSIDEKESRKWLTGLDWVNQRIAPVAKQVCVVADREADVFEYMKHPREANVDILLRATQPRRVLIETATTPISLKDAVEQLQVLGSGTVAIEREGKSVEVKVQIAAGKVSVLAPKHYPKRQQCEPIAMSVLRVRELEPVKGGEALEWVLLHSGRIENYEQAWACVQQYTQRWKIERFHFTLKSGMGIERLQFDSAKKLIHAIALLSIVAWRVLWVTYFTRLKPDAPAQQMLDKQPLRVLSKANGKSIATAREAGHAIAKLGGYKGPSGKYKEPGVKSIWRGVQKLQAMTEGWRLAHEKNNLQD